MDRILNVVKPNPGSDEALALGCKCPRMDNEYGRGHHGIAGEFVINLDCELHTMPMEDLQSMMGMGTK